MLDVLLVDDDEDVRESLAAALERAGHRVTEASDGERAAALASTRIFDVAICDVQLPRLDGIALFRRLRREAPRTSVVMITSFGNVNDVVGTLRDGAVDYVTKPFDPDEFAATVIGPIAERRAIWKRFEAARAASLTHALGARLVSESPAMRRVVELTSIAAQSDAPVLVGGERGAGKKLLARAIHERSPRRDGPLIVAPCATLPERMLDAELGDLARPRVHLPRDAWFRAAEGGTLVLDGVDQLPLGAQANLLRVLDEPGAMAHRATDWQPLGVRVVSLTRAPLIERVAAGLFLEPLFFRLAALTTLVPPLRDRAADLLPLVAEILGRLTPPSRTLPIVEPRAWRVLSRYPFPGNVGELAWALEYATTLADDGPIDLAHLPPRIAREVDGAPLPLASAAR